MKCFLVSSFRSGSLGFFFPWSTSAAACLCLFLVRFLLGCTEEHGDFFAGDDAAFLFFLFLFLFLLAFFRLPGGFGTSAVSEIASGGGGGGDGGFFFLLVFLCRRAAFKPVFLAFLGVLGLLLGAGFPFRASGDFGLLATFLDLLGGDGCLVGFLILASTCEAGPRAVEGGWAEKDLRPFLGLGLGLGKEVEISSPFRNMVAHSRNVNRAARAAATPRAMFSGFLYQGTGGGLV